MFTTTTPSTPSIAPTSAKIALSPVQSRRRLSLTLAYALVISLLQATLVTSAPVYAAPRVTQTTQRIESASSAASRFLTAEERHAQQERQARQRHLSAVHQVAQLATTHKHASNATRATITTQARTLTAQNAGVTGVFCSSAYQFPARLSQWTMPVSCYAGIYHPNPAVYPARPSYGWCSWWAEETHLQYSGSTALHLTGHAQPIVGAVVWFAPGVQGASSAGHYAVVEAIGPGGWLLVSEMHFFWRGGGYGLVDYRYVHEGPGVSFRY